MARPIAGYIVLADAKTYDDWRKRSRRGVVDLGRGEIAPRDVELHGGGRSSSISAIGARRRSAVSGCRPQMTRWPSSPRASRSSLAAPTGPPKCCGN